MATTENDFVFIKNQYQQILEPNEEGKIILTPGNAVVLLLQTTFITPSLITVYTTTFNKDLILAHQEDVIWHEWENGVISADSQDYAWSPIAYRVVNLGSGRVIYSTKILFG